MLISCDQGGADGLNFSAGESACEPGQYEGLNGACGEIPEGLEIVKKKDLESQVSSEGTLDGGSSVSQALTSAPDSNGDVANVCVVFAVLPDGRRPVIGVQPLTDPQEGGSTCLMPGFPLFHEFSVPSNGYVFALSDLMITTRIGCDASGCGSPPFIPPDPYAWTGNGGYRQDLGAVNYVGFAVAAIE